MSLKDEIQTDPLGIGYSQYLPHSTGIVVDLLNATNQGIEVVQDCWLNDRGLASLIIPAHGIAVMDSIFSKLDTASQSSLTVKRMVYRLYNDDKGLNFGDGAMLAMINSWRGTLLTEQEADALLALPKSKSSRAIQLFGRSVTEIEVITALESQYGIY